MNFKQPRLTANAEEEFVDRAAEMKTRSKLVNDNSATQSTDSVFPNETQTNSTCNKRLNNIMQALSKVLPQFILI